MNDVFVCQSWSDVKLKVNELENQISEAWNIGGPQLYEEQLKTQDKEMTIYLTQLEKTFDCDTFFPIQYLSNYQIQEESDLIKDQESGVQFKFKTLRML